MFYLYGWSVLTLQLYPLHSQNPRLRRSFRCCKDASRLCTPAFCSSGGRLLMRKRFLIAASCIQNSFRIATVQVELIIHPRRLFIILSTGAAPAKSDPKSSAPKSVLFFNLLFQMCYDNNCKDLFAGTVSVQIMGSPVVLPPDMVRRDGKRLPAIQ